jgi:uncharacterized protein with GYD domain
MLANWTDQGLKAIANGPRRLDAAKKTLEDMGGHFRSLHMTMGQFDLIGIYEAPDDAIAARYILTLGQLARISHRIGCIGALILRKSCCHHSFS